MESPPPGNFLIGLGWFLLSLLVGQINDVIAKYLGRSVSPTFIVAGRYTFASLSLFPILLFHKESFKAKQLKIHFTRGILLYGGIYIWCHCLNASELAVACLFNNTTPLFTLLLAAIALKEKVHSQRIVVCIIGFIGAAIVLNPFGSTFSIKTACFFLTSAILFSTLDILNKVAASKDDMLTQLFYTNLFTGIVALVFWVASLFTSKTDIGFALDLKDVFLLAIVGVLADFLMYCIVKSFRNAAVSAIAPFRFFEVLISLSFGWVFFGEGLSVHTIIGALLILGSNLALARFEEKKESEDFVHRFETEP